MNVSYNILFLIKSLYLIRRPRRVFTLYLYIVGIKHSNSSLPIFFVCYQWELLGFLGGGCDELI